MADFSLLGSGGKTETFNMDLTISRPTNIALAASANVKSAWFEVIASTSFDYEALNLMFRAFTGGHLFDLAVGASGSEEVIVENVLFSNIGGNSSLTYSVHSQLNIKIPAGSRIAFRTQSTTASANLRVGFTGIGGSFSSEMGIQKIVSYGANLADSGGAEVDPGGTANTKGAYTEIVASTSESIRGFNICFGDRDTSRATAGFLFDIAIGAGGSEEVIVSNYFFHTQASETSSPWLSPFFPLALPAGTRISARSQSESINATQRLYDVTIAGAV